VELKENTMKTFVAAAALLLALAGPALAETGEEIITACVDGETVQITWDEFDASGGYFGECAPATCTGPDTVNTPGDQEPPPILPCEEQWGIGEPAEVIIPVGPSEEPAPPVMLPDTAMAVGS
jgi:hypothetical protein